MTIDSGLPDKIEIYMKTLSQAKPVDELLRFVGQPSLV